MNNEQAELNKLIISMNQSVETLSRKPRKNQQERDIVEDWPKIYKIIVTDMGILDDI